MQKRTGEEEKEEVVGDDVEVRGKRASLFHACYRLERRRGRRGVVGAGDTDVGSRRTEGEGDEVYEVLGILEEF